jgi:hypothetical protein
LTVKAAVHECFFINTIAVIFGQIQNTFMKKLLPLFILLLSGNLLQAQYYYLDVLGTQQTNQLFKTIKTNQLKKITATSYENTNEVSPDFVLEQTISDQKIVTRSKTIGNSPSFFISIYSANKLIATTDSSKNAIVKVEYKYGNDNKLVSVSSVSKDFDGLFTTTEDHVWSYNEKGQPEKMLKIKNSLDTTFITFSYDAQENVAEEIWKKKNRKVEVYYYYYNPKNKLTDIVRFNNRARQMLPDYIFEYDNSGKLIKMVQSQHANANYLTYKYQYNDFGLKEKEIIFNKQKQLLGRIEYKYQ